MTSFLNDIKESVLEASEQIIRVVEEGTSVLMGELTTTGNKAPSGGGEETTTTANEYPMDDDMIISDEEDIANMKSPLDGITEGVLSDIMKNQAKPMSARESFDAFRSAITWSEPFILGLIAFHIIILLVTLFVTRRCGLRGRMGFLTLIAVVVRSAESLNGYGAKNWERFATQNYFDDRGIFISTMMSAPLLLVGLYMLVSYLREASYLLVEVKKYQIKEKQKKSQGNSGAKAVKAKKKGSKKED